jgi:hypothetical protein
MNQQDIGINDGNFSTGFGDDIRILELNELFSWRSKSETRSGSSNTIRRNRKNMKGRVTTIDNDSLSGEITGETGSTSEIRQGYTFEEDGFGWEIVSTGKNYSENDTPVFPITVEKCVNGLITAPARALALTDDAAMTAVDLTLSADLPTGGTWTLAGYDESGAEALTGLAEVSDQITGTPDDGAGTYYLKITYSVGTGESKKVTSRVIEVVLS